MKWLLVALLLLSSSGCIRLYHEVVHHQPNCEVSARSWDGILVTCILGFPIMLIEVLTVVPLVVDAILIEKHDKEYRLTPYHGP